MLCWYAIRARSAAAPAQFTPARSLYAAFPIVTVDSVSSVVTAAGRLFSLTAREENFLVSRRYSVSASLPFQRKFWLAGNNILGLPENQIAFYRI